jgi:uridine kinase
VEKSREILIFIGVRFLCFFLASYLSFTMDGKNIRIDLLLAQIGCDILIYFVLARLQPQVTLKYLWAYNPAIPITMFFLDFKLLFVMLLLIIFSICVIKIQKYSYAGCVVGVLCYLDPMYLVILLVAIVYGFGSPRYRMKLKKLIIYGTTIAVFGLTFSAARDLDWINLWIQRGIESDFVFAIGAHEISATLLVLVISIFYVYKTQRTSQNVFVIFSVVTATYLSYFQQNTPILVFISLPAMLIAVNLGTKRFILVILALEFLVLASVVIDPKSQEATWLNTALFAYFTFFAVRVVRHGTISGDVYKFAATPLSMAIAGDSGVGKDTFTQAVTSPFGPKFSNLICGDDYHRFERQDQAWLNTTHLNPRMNNLLIWKNHLRNALNRIPFNYQSYDHNTGKFQQGNASDSSDLVVSQGLHALYPELCKQMDLTIYLKMESELRVDLKIRRDSTSRTQSSDEVKIKIKERELDFEQYIATQESNADYVIHQGRTEHELRLPNKLDIFSERHLDIIRLLIQRFAEACGEDAIEFENLYSGSFSADTTNFTSAHVKIILKSELADFGQMFPNEPEFANGNEGLFQTLTFLHFDSIRRESHFLNYEAY